MLDVFDECVPPDLLKRIFEIVVLSCRGKYSEFQPRWSEFMVDMVPQLRRADVLQALLDEVFPADSEVAVKKRRTPSTNDVEIRFGQRVVLTTLTRAHRVTSVAPYRRRKQLADSRQTTCFRELGMPDAADESEGRVLYALLVYGGPHEADGLTFARVVFPDTQGAFSYADGIDLLTRFPDVADANGLVAAPEEELPDLTIELVEVQEDDPA